MPDDELFSRNPIGVTDALSASTIGIAGCGGLGSNAAVALVRAGLGKIILADKDVVEKSNLNRQYFLQEHIGRQKATALAEILASINPSLEITVHNEEISPDNVADIFAEANILIEALDRAESKEWLVHTWCKAFPEKPVICGSGISGCGRNSRLVEKRAGNIVVCGDQETSQEMGLCAPRVAIVANMQANAAIELLVEKSNKNHADHK